MTIAKVLLAISGAPAIVGAPGAALETTAEQVFKALEKDAGPLARAGQPVTSPPRLRDPRPPGLIVDGFKVGDPKAQVTGIVVSERADMRALEKAVETGANLVISRTSSFYDSLDRTDGTEAILKQKLDYIQKNKLVVLRFSDPRTGPEGVRLASALATALGWKQQLSTGNLADELVFKVPLTTPAAVMEKLRSTVPTRTARLIGPPQMKVSGVGFSTETYRPAAVLPVIAKPEVDLFISGELHETETSQYILDSNSVGRPKALILVGSIQMEGPAARELARRLKVLLPGIPVTYAAIADPFSEVP